MIFQGGEERRGKKDEGREKREEGRGKRERRKGRREEKGKREEEPQDMDLLDKDQFYFQLKLMGSH